MLRLHVICNPAARGVDDALVQRVATTLRSDGHVVRVSRCRAVAAAEDLIADTAARQERAVLVGGDGFLHTMVGPLIRHSVDFALLPAGRGNDFARELAIPTPLQAAIHLASTGAVRPVDALGVQAGAGEYFAATSVYAGIDSQVSQVVNGYRRVPAAVHYPLAAVTSILTFPPRDYRVEVDGVVHEYAGVSAIVANGGFYGNGMHIAPDAVPDDGWLDVVLLGAPNRARFLRLLPTVYRGTHVSQPEVTVLRGRRVRIDSNGVSAYGDGEFIAELPVTVEILPGALRVVR
ncbi:YegS/Rv2252/BmrU family lipid kinase [Branchiibius hedensis]|uniref:Lipid kinase, YegS/Rv2252/BmrU family n=1 Tax=Branchiibius hedensis TaxID=672460 RepID=A0A2Y8ZLY8_9MICO|nr:diacylglycerol kinase family protein [Branchiibius hedensis]PWJ24664.1 YegS/Rv2252/BmrU family lipid kinase [Branchiibius hedensis]SSA33481.1 lipid kinase, YegS/Rv2252/BmrU family [Branchiibius hedensis]